MTDKSKGKTEKPKGKVQVTPKGKAKKATQKKKIVRKQVPVRYARTPDSSSLSRLAGQFAHDEKQKCITPSEITINGETEGVYVRVLRVIDEFIFRAMMDKPSAFVARTNVSDPVIGFSVLRGLYLYAFQQYMYRCNALNDAYDGPYAIGSLKIPLGLAKIFQQFGPYCDPNTGATYKTIVQPLASTLVTGYYSIDSNSTGTSPIVDLTTPAWRYLIHASLFTAANAQMAEYGTLGDKSMAAYPSPAVPVFFSNYYPSIDSQILAFVGNLFPGSTTVDDIPTYAPDGTAYCYSTPSCITSPVPVFRADLAPFLGRGYSNVPPDYVSNLPYDKPNPVCRASGASNAEQLPNTISYIQTLIQTYVYLTSKSTQWVAGNAIGLLRSTQCFTDVTEFTYRSTSIDVNKVARKLFNVFKSDVWVNSTISAPEMVNTQFAFCQMFWTEFYTRIMDSASVSCTGNVATNTCFFSSNATTSSIVLPIVLQKIISGIGPVKVSGRPIFPFLGTAYIPFNTPAAQVAGWTVAVSSVGSWNTTALTYGFGPNVNPVGTLTLTVNGAAFSRTDIANVKYNTIMTVAQTFFTNPYRNRIPSSFIPDSLPTIANSTCGVLSAMLTNTNSLLIPTTNPTWTNVQISATGLYNTNSIAATYCINNKGMMYAANYSVTANYEDNLAALRPLRTYFEGTFTDCETQMQQSQNASEGSQFQPNRRAAAMNKYKPRPGQKDHAYFVASKLADESSNDQQSGSIPEGSGQREDAEESIAGLFQNAAISAGGEFLDIIKQTFSGASEDGGSMFETRWVTDITTVPTVKDAKNLIKGVITKKLAGLLKSNNRLAIKN